MWLTCIQDFFRLWQVFTPWEPISQFNSDEAFLYQQFSFSIISVFNGADFFSLFWSLFVQSFSDMYRLENVQIEKSQLYKIKCPEMKRPWWDIEHCTIHRELNIDSSWGSIVIWCRALVWFQLNRNTCSRSCYQLELKYKIRNTKIQKHKIQDTKYKIALMWF